jgi:hypothetical protein
MTMKITKLEKKIWKIDIEDQKPENVELNSAQKKEKIEEMKQTSQK